MKMIYDKVCPMCRMGLLHGEEEHFFYGGSVLLDCEVDGEDSAASEQSPTPEVLSTLQGESTPAHRK